MFRSLHLNFSLALSVPLPRAARGRRLSPAEHLGGAVARLSTPRPSGAAETVPRPWSGLTNWRESPINDNFLWGPDGPQNSSTAPPLWGVGEEDPAVDALSSLAGFGALVLRTSDPLEKARISHLAFARWLSGDLPVGEFRAPDRPARPMKPVLVCFSPFSLLGKFVDQFSDILLLRGSGICVVWGERVSGLDEGCTSAEELGPAAQCVHASQLGARRAECCGPRLGHSSSLLSSARRARRSVFL